MPNSSDELIYAEILEAILGQRLQPGTKLKEDDISQIFKASRTSVRRALLRLSLGGIVDIKHNKGAAVSSPSPKQAKEIIQARRLIEPEIICEVIQHCTENDMASLRALIKAEQERFENANRSSGLRISGDFHIRLAEISGNQTLAEIIRRLVPQTSLVIALYEKPGFTNCSHHEHYALVESILERDKHKAGQLMDTHLKSIGDKLQFTDSKDKPRLSEVFAHIAKD